MLFHRWFYLPATENLDMVDLYARFMFYTTKRGIGSFRPKVGSPDVYLSFFKPENMDR